MNRHINFNGKVRRWRHNLSYRNFYSGEIGEMRPVWLEDGVPGDTFEYTPEARIYFAPLLFPVLTKLTCRIDTFFVPNRLAWSEFENFITGGPDGSLAPAYPSIRHIYNSLDSTGKAAFAPWIGTSQSNLNGIFNNLGLPVGGGRPSDSPYDMIPYYDYLFIWDEYYRDEEKEPVSITGYGGIHRDVYDIFQNTSIRSLVVGNTSSALKNIAWAKDYFTSASLHQQRGADMPLLSNPMFSLIGGSLGTYENIYISGTATPFSTGEGSLFAKDANGVNRPVESVLTINGLRNLFAGSAWFNNNVIGGTRYIEQLRTRYHVVSSDARLQRPEMIGSSYINVNIDVVTQTSSTVTDSDGTQAIGDRAGKASVVGRGKTLTYSCEEFGYFISILHIAPKAAYFQGIRRNLQRESRWDFFQPELQFTPQQPIYNNEIWQDGSSNTVAPETCGVFGYIGVYDEYKHHNDEVHGDFQNTLLAWTMARKFSSLPAADSSTFLRVDHDTQGNNRIFAVPDTEYNHLFGVVNNIVLAKREISNKEPKF